VLSNAASYTAAGASASDARLELFLDATGVAKALGARAAEILDQVRKTRAAAADARKSGSAHGGARFASVGAVLGESLVPYYAEKLAASLDPLTKKSGTLPASPTHTTNTLSGKDITTTTTLDVTETLSSSGARVTLKLDWAWHTITKSAPGETLFEVNDRRTMDGGITVCPDGEGQVLASLDATTTFTGTTATENTTLDARTSSVFTGHVDDAAVLGSVTQTVQDKESVESSNVKGQHDMTFTMTYAADASGKFSSQPDASTAQGNLNVSDVSNASLAAYATKAAGWAIALDSTTIEPAYQNAQQLWRNGRCVMVTAPDYGAQTPIEVADQLKKQHDEEVDVSSETKFSVDLKHRFSGVVKAPVTAALSGDKKLDPTRVETTPSKLTYTAPGEEDNGATIQLRSVSKRGIGTLVIGFNTAAHTLTLNVSGKLTMQAGPFMYTFDVSVGPAKFKKRDATTYEALGPVTMTGTVAGLPFNCPITFTGGGTTGLLATREHRGNDSVWVVKRDPFAGSETVDGKYCLGAVAGPPIQAGGYGGLLMRGAEPIVIPSAGGTVSFNNTFNDAVPTTATGTAVGAIEKK